MSRLETMLMRARNERSIREAVVFKKEEHLFVPLDESHCITCNRKIEGFRDHLSIKEFIISGTCQACQDGVFDE